MLKRIVKSPYMNFFSGFVLLATSGTELVLSFEEYQIGAEHGVFVFGIVQVIKTIPDLLEGAKELDEAKEVKSEASKNNKH